MSFPADTKSNRPKLKVDKRTPPLAVMRAAKRAAADDDWLLRQWVNFSRAAYDTLDAEASEESLVDFWSVVTEWFDVTS